MHAAYISNRCTGHSDWSVSCLGLPRCFEASGGGALRLNLPIGLGLYRGALGVYRGISGDVGFD